MSRHDERLIRAYLSNMPLGKYHSRDDRPRDLMRDGRFVAQINDMGCNAALDGLVAAVLACALHGGEWVAMDVIATAYCPCTYCCGHRAAGVTADGTKVKDEPYGVAVDPKAIPLGTIIWIPLGVGYLDKQRPDDNDARYFQADDTGGAIIRETRQGPLPLPRIDLRFRTHWWAKRFGRKQITIYVWKE